MNDTSAKKDVQKLQRTVVDALEDVKAQDLVVFDTEHLSSLFERVVVASGTSNRQTKALASSVRDKVRDAGFGKPRIEGEDNGEWIIVDCGAVVVHIMQPTIRGYYNLEEIWGEKPVRLKFGAPKPAKAAEAHEEAPAKKSTGKKPAAKKAAADKKPAAKTAKPASRGTAKAAPAKKPAAKTPAKLPIVKVALKGAKSSAKSAARAVTTGTGKPAAKRPAAKKTTARKA
ncbi:MAG: Ribosomal silencing factor RsfS [Pseudomonadota bacterium]|jgi:ribosome-associated protein